jgi:hypothetical protein
MRLTSAMLFSALFPHSEMQEYQPLDWGEKFLDAKSRRQVRDQFEYQGSNVPLGVERNDLARHRRMSTR